MPAAAARSAFSMFSSLWTSPPPAAERRAAPRHQAALSAEVVSGGRLQKARIRNISTGGLTLVFEVLPPLFRGAQLLVRAPGFAPITGSVSWISGNECGLAFNVALADDLLDDESALFDTGKRPRPGRARIKLPAIARAPNIERKVMIENIGSGGAQICSSFAFPVALGAGLMLEVDGVLPIGGYVRWMRQGRCGLMFSKLLPLSTAQEIAERCAIHPSWLAEVRAAHDSLTAKEDA